ncbi:3532_t:CDS:2 [Ambispora gerdemannii]|uniref:3532_t:CDS:1 n=1 Tax=Ambispora gerdemannii TaxID=144530 RepID=A0A9N9GJJ0_9GLOM|nr:3532_t:CDS:2 [Ambispora gerdemannii]
MNDQPPPTLQQLFGGAIVAHIPPQFTDVRFLTHFFFYLYRTQNDDIREIPDNQEVFVDTHTDQSIVVEILELVNEASNEEAASYHFSSVAFDNDAEDTTIVQQTGILTPAEVPKLPSNTLMYFATGQQMVSKFNERDSSARNLVNIFLAVFRLPQHQTDLVITYNLPILIGETSSSRSYAQEGNVHVGYEEFKRILASVQIVDWSLFG